MSEIFVILICIKQTPVYSRHKSWSQGDWVKHVSLYYQKSGKYFNVNTS